MDWATPSAHPLLIQPWFTPAGASCCIADGHKSGQSPALDVVGLIDNRSSLFDLAAQFVEADAKRSRPRTHAELLAADNLGDAQVMYQDPALRSGSHGRSSS